MTRVSALSPRLPVGRRSSSISVRSPTGAVVRKWMTGCLRAESRRSGACPGRRGGVSRPAADLIVSPPTPSAAPRCGVLSGRSGVCGEFRARSRAGPCGVPRCQRRCVCGLCVGQVGCGEGALAYAGEHLAFLCACRRLAGRFGCARLAAAQVVQGVVSGHLLGDCHRELRRAGLAAFGLRSCGASVCAPSVSNRRWCLLGDMRGRVAVSGGRPPQVRSRRAHRALFPTAPPD